MSGVAHPAYLTATEAAALLGVSRNSLYSYVSRGLIRTRRDVRDPRISKYVAADVERLRARNEARRYPDLAARKTLDLGLPVLQSSLTLIDNGRLYYRGRDVIALARTRRFEDVVRLLWRTDREPTRETLPAPCMTVLKQTTALSAVPRMQALLPIAAAEDSRASEVTDADVASVGWRILALVVAAATRRASTSKSVAEALARGWRVRETTATRLIDAALILCADHELNVSAFTARVVASARSTPYDVVAAGLAALRGPLHGGHTTAIEALLDEAGTPRELRSIVAARVKRGEHVPGFGHPLYPLGDPRARLLLSAVRRTWPRSIHAEWVAAIVHAGRGVVGELPTIDAALVVLRRALVLPRDAALALFAIGRTAGWIAHAMEEYERKHLIRPRATYVGPQREVSTRNGS